MTITHSPARISVVLNMEAANVVRSPSREKLLTNHHGSSVVMPAPPTPAMTKNGSSAARVLARMACACTKVR